ncbi:MAG: hypothetical protein DI586_00280 [Micavibrio aeruginosavorus]|uniref:Uncharacterized protein n=1 Tax=Micavibrio aeruginosavorus TaxID=349221 RepID=A0A2W5FUK0_9BACT|nr:MAG: hypothetical protein DI586_00280 [Micavibrio aeruginosavorus]
MNQDFALEIDEDNIVTNHFKKIFRGDSMKKLSKRKIIVFNTALFTLLLIFILINQKDIRQDLCTKEITCFGFHTNPQSGCAMTELGECISPKYKRLNSGCTRDANGECFKQIEF